jgi:pimeloyl-ACP methyl ester carboxylesterase
VDLQEGRITVNDVELAYLGTGPEDGPLALCLHGFPDTAWTWRFLVPELAEAGFRVVAPFLRGYAPSAVPADGRYQAGVLALDGRWRPTGRPRARPRPSPRSTSTAPD